jgi:protein phosphatase
VPDTRPDGDPDPAAGNGRLRAGAVLAKLAWGLSSDPGGVRDHNEDFAAVHAPTTPDDAWARPPLFAVADGMGGHAAGEIASRTAVESLMAGWAGAGGAPTSSLRSCLRAAHAAVLDAAQKPGQRGMGTTLTALALNGREAAVGHVGDSRAYLIRDDRCTQLTNDHSRAAEMVRMKLITAEQAVRHPARSQLTRSLGGDPLVQIDVVRHAVQRHDVLVLCSDGLWEMVSRDDLCREAARLVAGAAAVPTPVALAERLTGMAIDREATDNVTAVVVHVTSDLPIPPTVARRSLFRPGRRSRRGGDEP